MIFTNDFTHKNNPTVKFIRKYTDDNNPLIYTDRIIDNFTGRFKKTNYTII